MSTLEDELYEAANCLENDKLHALAQKLRDRVRRTRVLGEDFVAPKTDWAKGYKAALLDITRDIPAAAHSPETGTAAVPMQPFVTDLAAVLAREKAARPAPEPVKPPVTACCEAATRIQRDDTELVAYACPDHGWRWADGRAHTPAAGTAPTAMITDVWSVLKAAEKKGSGR